MKQRGTTWVKSFVIVTLVMMLVMAILLLLGSPHRSSTSWFVLFIGTITIWSSMFLWGCCGLAYGIWSLAKSRDDPDTNR